MPFQCPQRCDAISQMFGTRFKSSCTMTNPFCPDTVKNGVLPPWEVAKAYAFHVVVKDMAKILGERPAVLLGKRVDDYIASKVCLKGGGHPSTRAIRHVLGSCSNSSWYPGRVSEVSPGRPPVYSEHIKQEIARVGMDLKRKNMAPTPRKVRARLPHLTRHPDTGRPIDKKTIHAVFQSKCYDENEDDPWQYLSCVSQDVLPEDLKPRRVRCAEYILKKFPAGAWYGHVAIDPCYSLLPKRMERMEEQQVKTMGKRKWMSAMSKRKGNNMRPPSTTNTQQGSDTVRVDWTPVFARGKIRIFVCDPERWKTDPKYPQKLSDSYNLAKFVRNILPGILGDMKVEYGWRTLPRTIVHDKASYMVAARYDRLQVVFAQALVGAGFKSWLGDKACSTDWLVKKLGDLYLHETAISHIRRLLADDFACTHLGETPVHFRGRMLKVENHMNSLAFARADGGGGLEKLAKQLRSRCQELIRLKGERLPK